MTDIISFGDHFKINHKPNNRKHMATPEELQELQEKGQVFIPETIEEELKAEIIVRLAKKLSLSDLETIQREWQVTDYEPNKH